MAEPNITKWLDKSRTYSFYDQMGFNTHQRLTITNAIIKLTDLARGSNLVKRLLNKRS